MENNEHNTNVPHETPKKTAVARTKTSRKKRLIGKVFIHNNLVEAHYSDLGAVEWKLLIIVAYKFQQLHSQLTPPETNKVSLALDEIAEYLGISRNNFPHLRQRIQKLQSSFLTYQNEQAKWIEDIPLFGVPRYHYYEEDNNKTTSDEKNKVFYQVDIEIHEQLVPFFLDLGSYSSPLVSSRGKTQLIDNKARPYTQILGETSMKFGSNKYTGRLYALMKKLENQTYKTITYPINEFQLLVGSKYKNWQHICENVITPTLEEINVVSEIWAEYEPITEKNPKGGRPRVTAVRFTMGLKEVYKAKKEANKKFIERRGKNSQRETLPFTIDSDS